MTMIELNPELLPQRGAGKMKNKGQNLGLRLRQREQCGCDYSTLNVTFI